MQSRFGRPNNVTPSYNIQRCRAGGHECTYEESNRGKRSTRKNEAIAMRSAKMESALRGIGAVSFGRTQLYVALTPEGVEYP